MPEQTFQRRSMIAASAEALRQWHFRPGAFLRLNPPWEKASVVEAPDELRDGERVTIRVGPLGTKWVAAHEMTRRGFIDRQEHGPFASWEHEHRFVESGPQTSELVDSIRYRLPFGQIGNIAGGRFIEQKLDRMFRYRHEVTKLDIERNAANPAPRPFSILVTGATGFVGKPLCAYLRTQGHVVHRVTRAPSEPGDIHWDPSEGRIELSPDLPIDGVIHLAGENVGDGPWTAAKKRKIRESRRLGTRTVVEAITNRDQPPSVLVSMSGSGIYPQDGGPAHTESDARGQHFLAEVSSEWEAETSPAEAAGIRVIQTRLGVVLDSRGGMLKKLLPLFHWGPGGKMGSGQQRISWIAMDDVLDILHRCLFEETWRGPINLTAPGIVTNREFAETLGAILHRPRSFPFPSFFLRQCFGEMAEETILSDIAVAPAKLESLAYQFRYPDLSSALRHLLGKHSPVS